MANYENLANYVSISNCWSIYWFVSLTYHMRHIDDMVTISYIFRVLEIIILFHGNNNHVVENEMVQRMLGKTILNLYQRNYCLFSQIPPFSRLFWFSIEFEKMRIVCTFEPPQNDPKWPHYFRTMYQPFQRGGYEHGTPHEGNILNTIKKSRKCFKGTLISFKLQIQSLLVNHE